MGIAKAPGETVESGGLEITELVDFEPTRLDGVKGAATGIEFLIMKSVAKGARDCPCGKSYDADASAENCEDCGKKLPDPASKASEPECKTCKDTGTIMDGNRDCPDCDAKPAKKGAADLAAAAVAKAVDASGAIDEAPDISLGQQIMKLLAQAIANEAAEIAAGSYGETDDVSLLNAAANMITAWLSRERSDAMAASDTDMMEMGVVMDSVAVRAIVAEELAKDKPAPEGAVAEGETTVDTDAQGTSSLDKAVEEAVTKATADQKAEIATLRSDLAKVLARPVPGGPVLSNAARIQGAPGDDSENWAAKAALCRAKADAAVAPADRAGYVQLAREYDEKAAKAAVAATT